MKMNAMKRMIAFQGALAYLLLLIAAPIGVAQDPPPAVSATAYEKIDLPAFFASPPKPEKPEDDTPSIQKEYQTKLKAWKEADRNARSEQEKARKASEEAVKGPGGKPMENYFAKIHFPLMTTDFSSMLKDRKYVTGELAKASLGARAELLKLAFDWSKKLTEGNYPPATRVNAVLLMSELNDLDGKAPAPPVPHRPALKYMLDLLDNNAMPPEVKQAALAGILRHMEIDNLAAIEKSQQRIPAAGVDLVVNKMIELMSAKDPPAGIEKSVFVFMQRRAATILGAYGQVGQDAKVYNALVAVVGNDAAPLWVRCDAATSLGRLNYTDPKAVDGAKGAKSLGSLVVFAANDELETLKKGNEDGGVLGGPGGMMGGPGGMGGYGAGGAKGGGMGGPPGGGMRGGPPGGGMRGGPPGGGGGIGGVGGGGGIGGVGGGGGSPGDGSGGIGGGGSGGGNPTYYAEPLVDQMVRRLMAAINSAMIGIDGANGRGSGLRKPKQTDPTIDPIAAKVEKLKAELVKLQKKEGEQAAVFSDFRVAVQELENVVGVKKKAGAEAAKPATPAAGGTTGGQ